MWEKVIQYARELNGRKSERLSYHIAKRIMDVAIGGIACLFAAPFVSMGVAANIITGNEVFFFQKRIGKNRKPFLIYKLGTMKRNSHLISTVTVKDDDRVTGVGKYMRKYKINELVQFLNVVLGDMSIVGPRPLVIETLDDIPEEVSSVVYSNKPGVTGWGSLYFHNEEERVSLDLKDAAKLHQEEILPKKAYLELWYTENKSILLDIEIIAATAVIVLLGRFMGGTENLVFDWMKRRMGDKAAFVFG